MRELVFFNKRDLSFDDIPIGVASWQSVQSVNFYGHVTQGQDIPVRYDPNIRYGERVRRPLS